MSILDLFRRIKVIFCPKKASVGGQGLSGITTKILGGGQGLTDLKTYIKLFCMC